MNIFKKIAYTTCALALSLSCDSGEDINPASGNTQDSDTRSLQSIYGTIQVSLIAPSVLSEGYTSVFGKAFTGPAPETIVWEETARQGDCALLVPRVPFCSDGCGDNSVCVEDDSCQTYPTAVEMGTLTISGLKTRAGESSFSMDPVNKGYQPMGGVIVDYPPCQEGESFTVSATGSAEVDPFTITVPAITQLEVLTDSIILESGSPLVLQWKPPAVPGNSRIQVLIDVSHHGGTKGKILCETDDSGTLEIAAELIDGLLALGVAGYPKVEITRRISVSSEPAAIDVIMESSVTQLVEIPGLVSCSCDDDCPEGQNCQWDFKCE